MPESLSEFAKTHPSKTECQLCTPMSKKLAAEMNAGIDAGVPGDIIRNWVETEHGIVAPAAMFSNHKRGYQTHPERHAGGQP